MSMYPPVRDTMIRLLSTPRLERYSAAASGDVKRGLELYRWNLDVSMAFFESIHYFEVALRNKSDKAMVDWYSTQPWPSAIAHQTSWLDLNTSAPYVPPAQRSGINNKSMKIVQSAYNRAQNRHNPVTHGHVVAELSLGWWENLLKNNKVWQNAFGSRVFAADARRDKLINSIGDVRDLRNRIAHHEPILDQALEKRYENIVRTAEFIEPGLGWWIDSVSRVEGVLSERP